MVLNTEEALGTSLLYWAASKPAWKAFLQVMPKAISFMLANPYK